MNVSIERESHCSLWMIRVEEIVQAVTVAIGRSRWRRLFVIVRLKHLVKDTAHCLWVRTFSGNSVISSALVNNPDNALIPCNMAMLPGDIAKYIFVSSRCSSNFAGTAAATTSYKHMLGPQCIAGGVFR